MLAVWLIGSYNVVGGIESLTCDKARVAACDGSYEQCCELMLHEPIIVQATLGYIWFIVTIQDNTQNTLTIIGNKMGRISSCPIIGDKH